MIRNKECIMNFEKYILIKWVGVNTKNMTVMFCNQIQASKW